MTKKKSEFSINIDTNKFILDGFMFRAQRSSDYISYVEFIKYFKNLTEITYHDLIIGINFTYGWMPTILDFRSDNFDKALSILNRAKQGLIPTIDELLLLMGLFNNSLVGATKILHFINPTLIPIWDSRVFRYLTGLEPYDYRISEPGSFLEYIDFCNSLIKLPDFADIKKHVETEIGYEMSSIRVVELIMYAFGYKVKL